MIHSTLQSEPISTISPCVQSGWVLLVDDNPANLSVLIAVLKGAGLRFRVATDGESALTIAAQYQPDLILLDVQMPVIDGFETCRRLKANLVTQAIPVIFTTALEDAASKIKAFSLGAVDYITKPFEPIEVLARVRSHLQLRQFTTSLEAQVKARTQELEQMLADFQASQAAFKDSEARFRSLTANLPGALYRCLPDAPWTNLYMSEGWKTLAGFSREEITHFADCIHPDDVELVSRGVDAALAKREAFVLEYRLVSADGQSIWVHEKGQGYWDEQGQCAYIDGIILDITERKRSEADRQKAEKARDQTELTLQKIADNTPGVIYQFKLSTDGTVSFPYISCGSRSLWEAEPAQIQADANLVIRMIHPDDLPGFQASVGVSAQTLQPWEWEGRIITPSGQLKWIQGKSGPERLDNGDIIWHGFVFDSSDRKLLETQKHQAEAERQAASAALEKKEAQYRSIFEAINDALFILDLETGENVEINPAACDMHGYSKEEFLQLSPPDFIQADSLHLFEQFLSTVKAGQRFFAEAGGIHKNGSRIDIEVIGVPFSYGDKPHALSFVRDISERTRLEAEREQAVLILQKQEQLLRSMYEGVEHNIVMMDVTESGEFHFAQWNRATEKSAGIASIDIIGKTPIDAFGEVQGTIIQQNFQRCLERGDTIIYEEFMPFQGQSTWWLTTLNPLKDHQGNIYRIVLTALNINDRKLAEITVQKQEQLLRSMYEGVENSITIVDVSEEQDFYFVKWNHATEKITGIASDDITGKTPEELLGEIQGGIVRQNYQRCLTLGTSITYEECLPFQGRDIWWLTTLHPLKDEQDKIYRIVITTFDITDRKAAEAALRQKEAQYRAIFESIEDGILICELDHGKMVATNPGASEIFGYSESEFMQLSPPDYVHADSLPKFTNFLDTVRAGKPFFCEAVDIHKNGSLVDVEIKAVPLLYNHKPHALALVRDISENVRLEAERKAAEVALKMRAEELAIALQELQRTQTQLVQSEKMSSLGQLVAGIAHEINNPVSFIHGNLKHINTYTQDLLDLVFLYQKIHPQSEPTIIHKIEDIDLDFLQEDLPKVLHSMETGTERIRDIVCSLRVFSRLDEAEVKAVNLHEGIDSTLMILQHRLKADMVRPEIKVCKHYGEIPLVECFAGQLNQVLMNIVANAIDILEARDKKRSLADIKQSPSMITITTEMMPSKHVMIRIADNGPGVPEALRERLFDPFFTTKAVGKGTGMGLSTSYQIVTEQHRGQLYFRSTLNQGTEFVIEIPVKQA
jgi:PAS domain S-box-containing protein